MMLWCCCLCLPVDDGEEVEEERRNSCLSLSFIGAGHHNAPQARAWSHRHGHRRGDGDHGDGGVLLTSPLRCEKHPHHASNDSDTNEQDQQQQHKIR